MPFGPVPGNKFDECVRYCGFGRMHTPRPQRDVMCLAKLVTSHEAVIIVPTHVRDPTVIRCGDRVDESAFKSEHVTVMIELVHSIDT